MDYAALKSSGEALTREQALREAEARSTTAGMGAFLPPPVMSGISVTPETALTCTPFFSAINNLSTDIASLPLEVKQRKRSGAVICLYDDPRYDLCACEPNEDTTSIRYRTAQMAHVIMWGNSYSHIERARDGTAAEFHLLSPRPNETRADRTRSGRLVYLTEGGRGPTLLAENVLHIAGLGWDGLTGYSVVAMGRQAIGLNIAAEQFGASFFGNGSTPKGALKAKGTLSTEAQARLRDKFERVHQGTVNANRIAIFEDGLEWQSIGVPPNDAQFLETRQFQVLEIARMFNMPPHKLGDYSQSHLANLEASNLDYLTTTLRPWLVAIEQECNRKLFTREERRKGYHVSHDMSALLRGDTAARTARNQAMRNGGSLSANEWRRDEGMNPYEPELGGDQYVIQGQYTPVKDIGLKAKVAQAKVADGADGRPGTDPVPPVSVPDKDPEL